jgi:Uri superfamily endonuclease
LKGSYILILRLGDSRNISVGRLGPLFFASGYYAYVGSALNGLEARLIRHLRMGKKMHWHIDYLAQAARIQEAIWARTSRRIECRLSRYLGRRFSYINRFGASDCRCKSHLFFAGQKSDLLVAAQTALRTCGLVPQIMSLPPKKSLT